jgi:hypothetical protein
MRSIPPYLAAVVSGLTLTIMGCSSDSPEEPAPAEEVPAEGEAEPAEDTEEAEADGDFPAEPVQFDDLDACDLLSAEAAQRLDVPETGELTGEDTLAACDWDDLEAEHYVSVVLVTDETAYSGFSALADMENLDVTDVEGYPAFEYLESGLCLVQLALAPDAVATVSGFQGVGSESDCTSSWQVAEEIVATVT